MAKNLSQCLLVEFNSINTEFDVLEASLLQILDLVNAEGAVFDLQVVDRLRQRISGNIGFLINFDKNIGQVGNSLDCDAVVKELVADMKLADQRRNFSQLSLIHGSGF